jgi:toxin ParE1/3/4
MPGHHYQYLMIAGLVCQKSLGDLDAILDYIAARLPPGGQARSGPHSSYYRPSLASSPHRHPHGYPAIRRLATPPYPYVIFYEATETESIIHAVRHQARKPSGMPGSA